MIHKNYNQKIGIIQNISCSFSHNVPKAVLTISHPSISNYQFQIFPLNQQLYVSQKNLSPEPPRFKTFPCTSAGNKEIYSPLKDIPRTEFLKMCRQVKFLEKDHQDDKKLCFKSAVKRRDPILVGSIEKMSRLTDISDVNGLKHQRHFYSFFIYKSISDGWVWVPLITYLATSAKVSIKQVSSSHSL